MSVLSILNEVNQPNGLPIVTNFTVPAGFGASQLLVVTGSAWSSSRDLLTVEVLIEHEVIGSMIFYSNEVGGGTHRTFAPLLIPQSLQEGSEYTLTLRNLNGSATITDKADWFSAALIG